MKEGDDRDALIRDHEDFIAELKRVCPEAVTGLAIAGPPPPVLSLRQRVKSPQDPSQQRGRRRISPRVVRAR